MDRFTGGCLCGTVRCVATGAPYRVGICHCLDCRKHHGALFHASAIFPEDAVTIEFRMKQHGLTRLEFGKSNRQWSLEFRDESITSRFGGDSIAVQTTQWRTYRIMAASDHALLYVDGSPVPAELHIMPAGTTCCNWVGFRKMGGSIPTQIDYVYFAIDGSYPPNPPFCGPDDSGWITGDLNYDCTVDLNDFLKLAENWLYHNGN